MFVIGTAGHVDHGKSSLLRALTGQEPDRLPEEKKRGMTIELNFVWMEVDRFGTVGMVDVPGHHRLVKNMISGVSNIDAFLFVVAADDGWMPQSEEHLRVLKALGVHSGMVVITKTDLVDAARVESLASELQSRFQNALGHSVLLAGFSAVRSTGLPSVQENLKSLLSGLPAPRQDRRARVWVDRVFTPRGLGVVVTGTLREGRLREGDTVFISPAGKPALVRSLQQYHRPVAEAFPVARVALQLSKIQSGEIQRGDLLQQGHPPSVSSVFDVRMEWFVPLKKNVRLSLHLGSLRVSALVVRLGDFVRVKIRSRIPVRSGERFLLRSSGEETLVGAGVVIDTLVARVHRKAETALAHWRSDLAGTVEFELARRGILNPGEFAFRSIYTESEIRNHLESLAERGTELGVGWVESRRLAQWKQNCQIRIEDLKGKCASEAQLLKEISLDPEPARRILDEWVSAGFLRRDGKEYRLVASPPDAAEVAFRNRVAAILDQEKGQPANLKEFAQDSHSRKRLTQWAKEGGIVSLGEDHYLRDADYFTWKGRVTDYLKEKGQASTSDIRIHLNTSRKIVVMVLERLDQDRLTYLRDGVRRLLRP